MQEEIVIWGVLEASGEFFILQLMSKRDVILYATAGVLRCIPFSRLPWNSLVFVHVKLTVAFRYAAFEFDVEGRTEMQESVRAAKCSLYSCFQV